MSSDGYVDQYGGEKGKKFIGLESEKWAGILDGLSGTSTLELAKKSWVFSVGCFCIPGMIYNAQKLRQLKCWKAYCYKYLIPTGISAKDCEKQYEYQSCVYVRGQYYVFLDVLAAPLKNLVNALENPIASGWVIAKKSFANACKQQCEASTCTAKWTGWCLPYAVMSFLESIAEITNTASTAEHLLKNPPETNYCDKLVEEDEQ